MMLPASLCAVARLAVQEGYLLSVPQRELRVDWSRCKKSFVMKPPYSPGRKPAPENQHRQVHLAAPSVCGARGTGDHRSAGHGAAGRAAVSDSQTRDILAR